MAQAGWYKDPRDAQQLRWWDGDTWTVHVRPLPQPGPAVEASTSDVSSSLDVLPARPVHDPSEEQSSGRRGAQAPDRVSDQAYGYDSGADNVRPSLFPVLLLAGGSLLAAIATKLPWLSAGPVSTDGYGTYGYRLNGRAAVEVSNLGMYMVAIAVVTVLAEVSVYWKPAGRARRIMALVSSIAGVLSAFTILLIVRNTQTLLKEGGIFVSVQYGIYLAVLGMVAAFVGVIAGRISRRG